jgi:thiamine-monophosphate kinase
LALGQWLASNRLATAMMDISDGLSMDLPRLCAASRVGAEIDANSLPLSPSTTNADAQQLALHGGDDYELLFTVPRRSTGRLRDIFKGLRLTPIGRITRDRKILLQIAAGKTEPLQPGGWDPFRKA